ncbi:hypothetical protein TcasGA2_TC012739 [Tribolium castaneum]|uniref:Uncharacterized protein n=1 Tax=Tribolium castaneum TaxID=7070 RepID=D6WZX4_TRICA|nr:hypothetical protein TcasGA2_TC012739 [Tribolium castaneum]
MGGHTRTMRNVVINYGVKLSYRRISSIVESEVERTDNQIIFGTFPATRRFSGSITR